MNPGRFRVITWTCIRLVAITINAATFFTVVTFCVTFLLIILYIICNCIEYVIQKLMCILMHAWAKQFYITIWMGVFFFSWVLCLPFSFLTLFIKLIGAITPDFFLWVDIFQNKSFNDENSVSSIPGAKLILFWSFSIMVDVDEPLLVVFPFVLLVLLLLLLVPLTCPLTLFRELNFALDILPDPTRDVAVTLDVLADGK